MSDSQTSEQEVDYGYNHVWTVTLDTCGGERELTFVAPAEFEAALVAAKALITKKWPNPCKDRWPDCAWHPDYSIVGIKRGLELDNEQPE